MGCHFLLQDIFPTQGSDLYLFRILPWQADSLALGHLGSPDVLVKKVTNGHKQDGLQLFLQVCVLNTQ